MLATAAFLGPVDRWHNAQLSLQDVQGLWGGREVYVSSIRIIVRKVSRGMIERRAEFVEDVAAHALFQLCIETDLLTIEVESRPGLPDEACPTLVLTNEAGRQHTVSKWLGQKVERFDRIYTALLALEKKADSIQPIYEGPLEAGWTPDKDASKE